MNSINCNPGYYLSDILKPFGMTVTGGDSLCAELVTDSRKVKPETVFIAVPGVERDGRDFITLAIEQGAVAILAEKDALLPDTYEYKNITVYAIAGLKANLGDLIDNWFGSPSGNLNCVGITGTNGKTSCSFFLADILNISGYSAGVMGTLGKGIFPELDLFGNTTPDVLSVHGMLADLVRKKINWSVMEVTSHALSQGRVDGVRFDAALFTNLSRDHLDYHQSMQQYAEEKARLFASPGLRYAVINLDDDYADMMRSVLAEPTECVTFSLENSSADIYLEDIKTVKSSTSALVTTPWGSGRLNTKSAGRFNLYNLLGVIGILGCYQFPLEGILNAVPALSDVPGRMNVYGHDGQPGVIVDYAHTPDALANALMSIREGHRALLSNDNEDNKQGRLICVFGCGGNRDAGKRSLMLSAALKQADEIVLTSDNPRFEDPEMIIQDILNGITEKERHCISVIVDRRQAIRETILAADVNDIILVAGKGHEAYQEVRGQHYHFDDGEEVKMALSACSADSEGHVTG